MMEAGGASQRSELVLKKGGNISSVEHGFEKSDVEQIHVKCKLCRKTVATKCSTYDTNTQWKGSNE